MFSSWELLALVSHLILLDKDIILPYFDILLGY